MRVADDKCRISLRRDLQLHPADEHVGAERPKVGLLDAVDAVELHDLLVTGREVAVELLGLALHEDHDRVLDEGEDAECDEDSDEH